MDDLKKKYLKPAEMIFTDQAYIIQTILGSCVAITMFASKRGFSSICHAMLPKAGEFVADKKHYKYLDYSFKKMLSCFQERGVRLNQLVVRVYGGADMYLREEEKKSVGRMNIEMAFQLISDYNLKLDDFNVGGYRGRKLIFDTRNGESTLVKEEKVKDLDLIKKELKNILKGNR